LETKHQHPIADSLTALKTQLETLGQSEEGLERNIEVLLSREGERDGPLTALLASRSATNNLRLSLLVQWTTLLDRKLNDLEARLDGLAGLIHSHDESIRTICHLIKDLDDPYGFGLSLDERIAGDGEDLLAMDPEG
jgi:hypothetical protein